ncbi:haloacid dehalogenase type II [Sphingomonas sp. PB2P12]|uniref:haloacid dehalogenase type II n=1 Tax=Sphingomonas sandaracina TaxID=3096157 RepID=UPI002FCAE58E
MTKRPLIVFDVNETLLDIDSLEPLFMRIFAVPGRMREWFAQVILYSQALSLAGPYVPFGTLGGAVLHMIGEIHGVAITDEHVRELGTLMADMPVHADVAEGLGVLKDAGFSLVTLTNSPASDGPDALNKADLGSMFDRRFTVDTVRKFKPSPATYRLVQDTMGSAAEATWLIAAHTWDTIGAQSFGWKAALVTRGANAPLVLADVPQPTLIRRTVSEAAYAIAAGL